MQGRSFTKFQNFNLAIRRMISRYKNYFIDKANYCLKIENNNVNNIPFELEIQDLGTTFEIWGKYIHLDTPKHTDKFPGNSQSWRGKFYRPTRI